MLRLVAIVVLVWALGFAAFVVALPEPAGTERTDAIVVPTGAPGRIARGVALLEQGRARRLLVSGVDPQTRGHEIALSNGLSRRTFDCCIDLGREASDTRSNAEETTQWLVRHRYRSVRLVTTDWHMPRARFELRRVLPADVVIVADAVESQASFAVLMREYNKYLLRRIAVVVGL